MKCNVDGVDMWGRLMLGIAQLIIGLVRYRPIKAMLGLNTCEPAQDIFCATLG
ncbi:MAG: hypothetical protein AB1810_13705 [Pseudomonadota bacterium]